MKRVFFRGVFCRWFMALTLVGLMTFSVSGAAAAFKNIKVGDKALPFQLEDLDGQEYALADFADAKAVLLLFWATWSQRSLTELADLVKFQEQYGDMGLEVLTINVENQTIDAQDVEQIRKVLEDNSATYPVLLDKGLKTYNEWGVIATPTTAIITGAGVVSFDLSSYPSSAYVDIDIAIQKALGLYVEEEESSADAEPAYTPTREALLRLGLGKRHAEKGFMTKALPELEKAAVADSGWAEPHLYLGFVHFRMGDVQKAGASLEEADRLDPERAETAMLRAYILLTEEKVDDALSLLQGGEPVEPQGSELVEGRAEEAAVEAVTAPPGEALTGTVKPGAEPVDEQGPVGGLDLSEVTALKEEGKTEDAARALEDLLLEKLEEAGFTMKKKKKMSAMERMKLMMEKKQGQ